MTPIEYTQMRAFARYDGFKLFVLWLISFILYVAGLKTSFLGTVALIFALITPFMSKRLLLSYRDTALDGVISFRRAWVYVIFHFFYASLLFAMAQFVYFNFMDKGYFMGQITEMLNEPATAQAMQQMGMGQGLAQAVADLSQMRPIDLVLNIMTSNLLIGLIIGLPLAIYAHRSSKSLPPSPPQEEHVQQ